MEDREDTEGTTAQADDDDTSSGDEDVKSTDAPGSADADVEDSADDNADPDADADAAQDEASDDDPESDDEADADLELDEETIEALVSAYGDQIRQSKGIGKTVEERVKAEVQRQVSEQTAVASSQSQTEQLISQGRTAAQQMAALATNAQTELDKAKAGDKNANLVFDSQQFKSSLQQYGSATALYERNLLETAEQGGFDSLFGDVLPELSDTQLGELQGIRQTADRMRGDDRQFDRADAYRLHARLRFAVDRAIEHGAAQERARLSNRKTVKGKVASTNAVAAAKAKLAKGKKPPRVPKSDAKKSGPTDFSDAGYDEFLKTKPSKEEEQSYIDRWARSRVPRVAAR